MTRLIIAVLLLALAGCASQDSVAKVHLPYCGRASGTWLLRGMVFSGDTAVATLVCHGEGGVQKP